MPPIQHFFECQQKSIIDHLVELYLSAQPMLDVFLDLLNLLADLIAQESQKLAMIGPFLAPNAGHEMYCIQALQDASPIESSRHLTSPQVLDNYQRLPIVQLIVRRALEI